VATGASVLTSQLLTTVGAAAAPTAATLLTNLASTATPGTPLITAGEAFTLRGQKGGRELAERSFTVTAASTVADFNTFLQQGMGVNTTVPDDGNPLTPTAGAALEADATDPNSARLVLTGNLGAQNSLSLTGSALSSPSGLPFTFSDGANAAGVASNPVGESVHTTFIGYDSLGTPVAVDVTAVLESKADTGNVWRFYATSGDDSDVDPTLGTGTLTFNSQGQLTASTGTTLSIDRANTGAGSPLTIGLDFAKLTSLTSRDSSLISTRQDGSQRGTLDSFSIGTDGTIVGSFSNGQTRTLGQVAVATFANNRGLIDKGGNMFVPGGDSGDPLIAAAMELGSGGIRSGTLEQSNVDLSEEFVNMIISSTGFSASSRVITTSDRLITELLNSSR
jgi:flagellar hook protein FlgE